MNEETIKSNKPVKRKQFRSVLNIMAANQLQTDVWRVHVAEVCP